jgi:predicted phosphodiesterase
MYKQTQPFKLIGDPHITRKFDFGVPLARKGERERSLFVDLNERLNSGDEPMVIMVGDLLEKPLCSLQDLYSILEMILKSAYSQPYRTFVMMAGNHDISAQKETKGGFDILNLFNGLVKNLIVVMKPTVINKVALFPWEWDRTALEQLEDVRGLKFRYAVGHWDLVKYDEMYADHMCPALELTKMGAEEIFSGHWHIPGRYVIEGIAVTCTGSMQPMSHAEDPNGKLYVTLSLEEYLETNPEILKNKYVRVLAEKGEEVTQLPDCLGFKVQRVSKIQSMDDHEPQVSFEGFKVSDVVKRNLAEHNVPEDIATEIKGKLNVDD